METSSFHFLRQQSTAACGSSFFFNVNISFSQSFILASGNEFFVYWKQYCIIPSFSLLVETTTEIREKSIFKDESYSCWWTPIFWVFQRFFKVETAFSSRGAVYCNKSFIWLVETDFLASVFWSELFFYFCKPL